MVRGLTEAEARVIAVLLAARPDRERERLRIIDVPRSTYHAIRKRAYDEGWLRDRYVPHPVAFGRPVVTFLVARPYADKFDELVETVGQDPGAVVVWRGTQVVLAVLWHRKPGELAKLLGRVESGRLAPAPWAITVRPDGPSVPVFFDYEGLWCHVAGLEGTLAYPHGLGGGTENDGEETSSPPLSSHQWWAASELVRRPFAAAELGKGGHLVGPLGLPFSQRRLLQKGWVVHRTILDPGRLPPFQGRAADQVVLVAGTPRNGARPDLLFATLSRESRVYPFLFATAPDRWLFGALGGSTPPAPESEGARRPVLPTMREYLEGIEILQEPAAGFLSTVDHRYDRLLPPRQDGSGGPA
ncbi:MAG TPA: hypothetical protein VMI55_00895 [Thermoplasmata archaeon]|nr:hypothetical protein [Thermoplasmata archaeon]